MAPKLPRKRLFLEPSLPQTVAKSYSRTSLLLWRGRVGTRSNTTTPITASHIVSVSVSQCSVTVYQCHSVSVTLSQCNSVTVSQFHIITVYQCHSVTLSQCNSVTPGTPPLHQSLPPTLSHYPLLARSHLTQ